MFEKVETRTYAGADPKAVHAQAYMWWQQQGFQAREIGPGQFSATSAAQWGLQREAIVTVRDMGENTLVELRMKAKITDEGLVAGGLALVFVWPVAVVGGAYSYTKYEEDAVRLMGTFWSGLEGAVSLKPTDMREQVIHTTAVPTSELQRAQAQQAQATGAPAPSPLSREEKLALLEDRLARGEISEQTFKEIREHL